MEENQERKEIWVTEKRESKITGFRKSIICKHKKWSMLYSDDDCDCFSEVDSIDHFKLPKTIKLNQPINDFKLKRPVKENVKKPKIVIDISDDDNDDNNNNNNNNNQETAKKQKLEDQH